MVEVVCDNCGTEFDKQRHKVENSKRDFCSLDCYHEFGHEGNPTEGDSRVEKTCGRCGDRFKVYPYRADSASYCSTECSAAAVSGRSGEDHPGWKGDELRHTCLNCGDEFRAHGQKKKPKYCSKECYREAASELFAGENNPVWRGGWEWYYGENWEEQREKAIARDDYRCQDCGVPQHKLRRSIDVHHKKRLGWFREEFEAPEWWQRGNRLENLIALCPSCHKKREWRSAD